MLQLLRDYRTYHTAFGSAMALDETGVKDASYGPAGLIETGQAFGDEYKALLHKSYIALDQALTLLENGTPLQRAAWLVLLEPYLGDPADPSVVHKWRRNPNDHRTQWHDLAVEELAEMLRAVDLYVAWPKRMTTRKSKVVDELNDELWRVFCKLREEGMPKSSCIKTAATLAGYSERSAWRIVRNRESEQEGATKAS